MSWRHLPREGLRFIRQLPDIAKVRFSRIGPAKLHNLPGKLIVSLTSHPPRFLTLGLTLRSLLLQDVRPDAVVLWLAKHEMERLPDSVRRLQLHGLTISVCEDTKSYKKIIPALSAYPDAFIVTADDDINYQTAWLRRFVDEYRSPDEILCQRARRFTTAGQHIAPYDSWPILKTPTSDRVFPTGLGGVLYPPGSLRQDARHASEFMRLCPNADDVWLYWTAREGITHRLIEPSGPLKTWGLSQFSALYRDNGRGGNDRQIAALVAAYGLPRQMGHAALSSSGVAAASIAG